MKKDRDRIVENKTPWEPCADGRQNVYAYGYPPSKGYVRLELREDPNDPYVRYLEVIGSRYGVHSSFKLNDEGLLREADRFIKEAKKIAQHRLAVNIERDREAAEFHALIELLEDTKDAPAGDMPGLCELIS